MKGATMAGFKIDYEHSAITITGKVEPKDGLLIAQYQQAGYKVQTKQATKKDKDYYRHQLTEEQQARFNELLKAGKLEGWRKARAYAIDCGAK